MAQSHTFLIFLLVGCCLSSNTHTSKNQKIELDEEIYEPLVPTENIIEEELKALEERNNWKKDVVKTLEKKLDDYQKSQKTFFSKPTTFGIPLTHYLYEGNTSTYETVPANQKSEQYCENDLFCHAFLRSARFGAVNFNLLQKEIAEKGEKYTPIKPQNLPGVIDLVNFFVFTAVKQNQDKFKIDNLALIIEGSKNFINILEGFFSSYQETAEIKKSSETKLESLFKKSEHEPWFSIHLRKSGVGHRDLLYGLDCFKSIGINRIDDKTLEIRMHNRNQGRPDNWQNQTNKVTLDYDNLTEASALFETRLPWDEQTQSVYEEIKK